MSSDVKIPDAILDQAFDLSNAYPNRVEAIALALLAAEQRGRKAGLEEAAKVAFDEMFEAVDAIRARKLQTAIRSLGDKT